MVGYYGALSEDVTMPLNYCIACGCHDQAACWDEVAEQPCYWLRLDEGVRLGVCSACPGAVERWDAGERSVAVPVADE